MRRFSIAILMALFAAFMFAPTGARAQVPPAPVQVQPAAHIWVPWAAVGCIGSIIVSGVVANWKDNRQLTNWEAWTCGLLYWVPMPPKPPHKHHHHAALSVDRPRYG